MGSGLSSTLDLDTAVAGERLSSSRYVHLGPFQVDQRNRQVTKNGVRLKLQDKVYEVLLALIEKQGEIVTREELRVRLWPADTHVDYDSNVNTAVNKLRRALGDSSDQPLYIETLPRKGYCLIIPAEFAHSPLPRAKAQNGSLNGGRANSAPVESELWITFAVIGLILAGMLLGVVITKLWITSGTKHLEYWPHGTYPDSKRISAWIPRHGDEPLASVPIFWTVPIQGGKPVRTQIKSEVENDTVVRLNGRNGGETSNSA
jgi:DNA-binding winged helix-turn-helix (wHTH) protein